MNMLKISTLSISLATVTSGAAVAPALGLIAKHFSEYSEFYIKLIITIPSIFIIFSSLAFAKLSNYLNIKQLISIGFILFILGGVAPFFLDNIYLVLLVRAVLGLGAGFLMPLSVSLLGFLFPKNEQIKLMSLSGMCNQLGAVLTVSFSGFLASISWQFSFLIYLFAVIVYILALVFLPNIKIGKKDMIFDKKNAKCLIPIFFNLFMLQVLFYSFTNNFSIVYEKEGLIKSSLIGVLMGVNGLCGAFASMQFVRIKTLVKQNIKYLGSIIYISAFFIFSLRFEQTYYIFGINLMLVLGIIGAMLNGFATGIAMPFLLSQVSLKSKKLNLAKNMSIGSISIFSGQFLSPFIDEFFIFVFKLEHIRDSFLIACCLAVFLLFYNLLIKIKIKD